MPDARAPAHDWLVPDWPVHPRVRAFVTTRQGGVSQGPYATLNVGGSGTPPDDAAAVTENRRLVAQHLPAPPTWLHQVHGSDVATLAAPMLDAPVADAAVTRTAGVPLAVRIADCLPIFLAARDGSAIGVAHAGWRGLAAGVVERTLEALQTDPSRVAAWIGPGIGPDRFEVGDDVHAAFVEDDRGAVAHFHRPRAGKWLADLPAIARRRLAARGVREVHGGHWCTATESERFFSYRRDRTTGRMAAIIWIEPEARR